MITLMINNLFINKLQKLYRSYFTLLNNKYNCAMTTISDNSTIDTKAMYRLLIFGLRISSE